MSLPNDQRTVQDSDGNEIPFADIEVRDLAGGLVTIYSDPDGATEITQPGFQSDANGFYRFYAQPGYYEITVTGPEGARVLARVNLDRGVTSLSDITSISSLNTAALVDGQQFSVKDGAQIRLFVWNAGTLSFDELPVATDLTNVPKLDQANTFTQSPQTYLGDGEAAFNVYESYYTIAGTRNALVFKAANGSAAAPEATPENAYIANLRAQYHDGTSWVNAGDVGFRLGAGAEVVWFSQPSLSGVYGFANIDEAMGPSTHNFRELYDSSLRVDTHAANVADLVANDVNVGAVVQTLGYTTNYDGGSNVYLIVAGGTGVADGGSYINLANGLQARALFTKGVNVKQFGAIGDGVTSDQTAVSNAVAFCNSNDHPLNWPQGDYVSTASINNFHNVKNEGPGTISRGSSVWYADPTGNQTNTLHVSATGSAANDGLSSSEPLSLVNDAFLVLDNRGFLKGKWEISLAAGTYSEYGITLENVKSEQPIRVFGPSVGGHPNVPTALVGPATTAASGWRFTGSDVILQDVKFRNFSSSASSFGVAVVDRGALFTINTHTQNCHLGIVGNGLCKLDVKGGIIEDSPGEGIRSLFGCAHSIGLQNATDTSAGPIIRNNNIGLSARESSSGHCDFAAIEDNTYGIDAQANARVNCSGSNFKRNSVAIRSNDANVLAPTSGANAVVFNTGTVDSNAENIRLQTYGTELGRMGRSNTARIEERNVQNITHTGTVEETVLRSYSFGPDYLKTSTSSVYLGKKVSVKFAGTTTTAGSTKSLSLDIAGVRVNKLIIDTTRTGRFEGRFDCYITSSSEISSCSNLSISGYTPLFYRDFTNTANFDTGADILVELVGQLNNSSDALVIDFFEVEVDG